MKRVKLLSILMALVMLFSIPTGVFAAETGEAETLPDPGTTPDSPFYFLDKWGKQIGMAFTFGAENKARRALAYADERIAEIEAMMAQNKVKEAAAAGNEYQYCIQTATKNLEQAKLKGVDVGERIALMAEKHLEIANRLSENASQEAQAVMTQTRERAMTCQETALKYMAQGDPGKAAQVNLQLMERQLHRIRTQAEEAGGEAVQRRLEEYNRLGNLNEEIAQIAKRLGQETTVDQLVGQATAHHLEILTQVQQRVQGEAQDAVENALQNCIQNHEQLVTRLQAQNQLGPVPEEIPLQNTLQNRDQQSAQTMTQKQIQTKTNQNTQVGTASTETQNQSQIGTQTQQGTQNTSETGSTSTTSKQGSASGGS